MFVYSRLCCCLTVLLSIVGPVRTLIRIVSRNTELQRWNTGEVFIIWQQNEHTTRLNILLGRISGTHLGSVSLHSHQVCRRGARCHCCCSRKDPDWPGTWHRGEPPPPAGCWGWCVARPLRGSSSDQRCWDPWRGSIHQSLLFFKQLFTVSRDLRMFNDKTTSH